MSSQIKRLAELMDPTPWNVSDFKLDLEENEPTWINHQRNPVSTFYWTNQLWERLQNPHKDPNTAIKTSSTDVYVLGEYSIHTFYIDNALGQGVGARCRELFLGDIPRNVAPPVRPRNGLTSSIIRCTEWQTIPASRITTKELR